MLTPLRNTIPGTPEDRFNICLKSIRSIIERCNGILKNRWRCLLKHRVLHYSPQKAASILKACCVLHNMCIERHEPELEIEYIEEFDHFDQLVFNENPNNDDLQNARELQNQLINNYFQN